MRKTFEQEFEHLMIGVQDTYPEATDWFFPSLAELIQTNDKRTICDFARTQSSPAYVSNLLIKAGFREIETDLLLEYLKEQDEDEVYDAAVSLAIYGDERGFEVLKEYAAGTHPLLKYMSPQMDIPEDLVFLKTEWAAEIEALLKQG